ncbi:MAG: hypothetical protein HYZ53_22400 [Planctomycetes bacterium]|nr:hypothetical protein [Planctomycetota bacterium]
MLRLFAVCMMACAFALAFGLCLPAMRTRELAKLEWAKIHDELVKCEEQVVRIVPGLEAKRQWVRVELERTALLLPGEDRIDDMGVEVAKAVERSGVQVERRDRWLTNRDAAKGPPRLFREMTVSGTYSAIAGMLRNLVELPYSLSVDDLEIACRPANPETREKERVVATLMISLYFRAAGRADTSEQLAAPTGTARGAAVEKPPAHSERGSSASARGPTGGGARGSEVSADEDLGLAGASEDPIGAEQDRLERLGTKTNPFAPVSMPRPEKVPDPGTPASAHGASSGVATDPDPVAAALRLAGQKLAQVSADMGSSGRGWSYLVASNYPPEPEAPATGIPDFPGFERETSVLEVSPTDGRSPQPNSGWKRVTITVYWNARAEKLEAARVFREHR